MDAAKITSLVQSVTKKWAKQRKAEEREANARARRHQVMTRSYRETIKDVACEIMEQAYLKASSGGTLPAHARQIMYAARGEIQRRTERKLDDQYFTQTLLVDYLNENDDETDSWDVVFDARGHFQEPHTERVVPLGTLDVREYLERVSGQDESERKREIKLPDSSRYQTVGPQRRFSTILFIEKEGFLPLFDRVKLAERYDIAIMSTKGMSVTAARQLVEHLTTQGVTIVVMKDFDKAGFSIVNTLRSDTRRFQYSARPNVIDLGLRLTDVEAMGLGSEPVEYDSTADPRNNLRESGATEEECNFLVSHRTSSGWKGKRVELNMMTSRQFLDWMEAKFAEAGVQKVVPDQAVLEKAYRRAVRQAVVQKAINDTIVTLSQSKEIVIPPDLTERVRLAITNTAQSWDIAVWQLAGTLYVADPSPPRGTVQGKPLKTLVRRSAA